MNFKKIRTSRMNTHTVVVCLAITGVMSVMSGADAERSESGVTTERNTTSTAETLPARSSGFHFLEQERTIDVHINWYDYWGTGYYDHKHDEALDFAPYSSSLERYDPPAYAYASQNSSLDTYLISTVSSAASDGQSHNGSYSGRGESNVIVSFTAVNMREVTLAGEVTNDSLYNEMSSTYIVFKEPGGPLGILYELLVDGADDHITIDETIPVEPGMVYTLKVLVESFGPISSQNSITCNMTLTAGSYCVDLTGDNLVDIDDIFAVSGYWGQCADPCPPVCPGDINFDCTVNIDDIFALLGEWGECE